MAIRKELLILTALSTALLIASIVYYFGGASIDTSPQASLLEECKSIKSGNDRSINFVFFADKEQAEKYSSLLLSSEPFSENPESFNIYYIDSFEPECELYQGIATLCYSKELIKKSSSCPNDYVIVIDDKPGSIRSTSYLNVLSLNKNHPTSVILHELGHALGNFAEEYITNKNPPKGSKNCVSECSQFRGIEEGCYEGCTKSTLFRSSENSIMRTLDTTSYGKFNEALLISKISDFNLRQSKISGSAIDEQAECSNEKYFLIEAVDSDTISVKSKTIESGCPNTAISEGGYSYNVYSSSGEMVLSNSFNPEIFTDIQDENQLMGETYTDSSQHFFISVPYDSSFAAIEIIGNEGQKTLENLQNVQENLACHI